MIIGLTGGIASGKSTVSHFLKELGAAVIDADEIARELTEPGQPLYMAIGEHFGGSVLSGDGSLNRSRLGELVFADSQARCELDRLSHPIIKAEIEKRLDDLKSNGIAVIVLDVPLLFEVGWEVMADETWVVYVDSSTQLNRLMARNNFSCRQASQRIASQMSLEEKRQRATFVIDNTRDLEYTREQVLKRWRKIKEDG